MGSHGRRLERRWVVMVILVMPWLMGTATVAAAAPRSNVVPSCQDPEERVTAPPEPSRPRLRQVLDERSWLVGYRLASAGRTGFTLVLGRIAFLDGPFGDRWIFGDARHGITHLRVLDAARACVEAEIDVDGLVFSASLDPGGTSLVHDLVDPGSRAELGVWRRSLTDLTISQQVLPGVGPAHPVGRVWSNSLSWSSDGGLLATSCGDRGCITRTGQVTGSAAPSAGVGAGVDSDEPRVDPRPVPETGPATWAQDALLTYRWAPAEPSAWVRRAINDAADDASTTRGSKAARFAYSATGDDTIGLDATMTGPCVAALACAHGVIPSWWQIRIRPQGTQVDWGTVRWCQAYADPPVGCYDLEHVMLHEFGHIEGLAHPEAHGFRLGVLETVMATTPPQRPQTGWDLHRFGPCDVARLQRRYDIGDGARLAQCGRLDTRLTIDASAESIGAYQPVTITATLRVKDLDAYDRLGGNRLSGREVVIERRPHGTDTWIAYDADPGTAAGTYVLSFRPAITTQFRASFDRPGDEGLTAADSAVLTVTVGPCSEGPCPDSPWADRRHE